MTHTINGKEYNLTLTGTVGIVYNTQRLLGHAPDTNNGYDMAAILYCALKKSNKDMKDFPSLEDFIDRLTSPIVADLMNDFWPQWQALEGQTDTDKPETGQGDKKGED